MSPENYQPLQHNHPTNDRPSARPSNYADQQYSANPSSNTFPDHKQNQLSVIIIVAGQPDFITKIVIKGRINEIYNHQFFHKNENRNN